MTSSNRSPSSRGISPANITATTMVFRICSGHHAAKIDIKEPQSISDLPGELQSYISFTMSVHSWTLSMMTDRPCGIQDSSTVAARMDSQHTYRPLAAVYSSWTTALPIQKDISQRPAHTGRQGQGRQLRTEVWRKFSISLSAFLWPEPTWQCETDQTR